jgi:hypothetical protein
MLQAPRRYGLCMAKEKEGAGGNRVRWKGLKPGLQKKLAAEQIYGRRVFSSPQEIP